MKQTLLMIMTINMALSAYAEQTFESGQNRVSLVELYTSEGCSSCPPADRFLSTLKADTDLFRRFIPIAFHVDYWDYLGWKDPYADQRHSQRQRLYNQVGRTGSVYTPGFVIDGQEWRGFFNPLRRALPATTPQATGNLKLSHENGQYTVEFDEAKNQSDLVVYVAQLGTGLSTQVTRGENTGRQLNHDFVVLSLKRQKLNRQGKASLKSKQEKNTQAIAAWVSRADDPAPIQAVAGWLAVHKSS